MKPGTRELWWAMGAILAITAVYLLVISQLRAIPAASGLFGHGIGVIGFVLMLATETLYSLRKRSRRARWGRTAAWLRFHIVTGLVGPYMVLLHTSWKFNGLAGLVVLMTIVVVISGFIGRYIYTAVPRTVEGLILEADQLQAEIAGAEAELRRWLAERPAVAQVIPPELVGSPVTPARPWRLVLVRPFDAWKLRQEWRRVLRRLDPAARDQGAHLAALALRKHALQRQAASLAAARQLLGIWHTIHIPLGMALFTAAFVHIVAALYFATLLH